MKKIVFFVVIAIYAFDLYSQTENILAIAISDFKTQGDKKEIDWIGTSCADALVYRISTDKKVKIIDREYINKVIEELKLQMSGLVDEKKAVEVGKIIGANFFVFGSATVFQEKITITLKTVNIETTEIVGSSRIIGELNNLFQLQDDIAKKLSEDLALSSVIYNQGTDFSDISFSVYSNLEKLKVLSRNIPLLSLDPSRKNRKSEYLMGVDVCDAIIKSTPKLFQAHCYKALFCMQLEDFDNASSASKTALQLNPTDADVLYTRANYFYNINDYENAKNVFLLMTTKAPADARGWYGLSKTYYKLNQDIQSAEALINCLVSDKFIPEAESNLRSVLAGQSNLAKEQFSDIKYFHASKLFKAFWDEKKLNKEIYETAGQLQKEFPELYISYYIKGVYEKNNGKLDLAESDFNKCLNLRTALPESHRELGFVYFRKRLCGKAEQQIKIYLKTALSVEDYDKIERERMNCK